MSLLKTNTQTHKRQKAREFAFANIIHADIASYFPKLPSETTSLVMTSSEQNLAESDDRQHFNVDQVLEEVVSPIGLWQWFVVLYLMLTTPTPPTFPVFANSSPPHRCAMEPRVEKFIENNSLPFNLVVSHLGPVNSGEAGGNKASRSGNGCKRFCLDWENVNLTEEFETVCERSWLVPIGTSVYMFGMLVGFFVGGWFGDYFGRRKALWLFSCLEFGASIGVSLSPNFPAYVVLRALVAIGNTVKMCVGNVLAMEITTAKYRSLLGAILALGLDFIFRALMALYAYLLPNWRWLNLMLMATSFFGLFYIFLLPESPRWLIAQGEYQMAVRQLHAACVFNHRKNRAARVIYLEQLSAKAKIWEKEFRKAKELSKLGVQPNKRNIFRPHKDMIVTTILVTFVVFCITMCFFGIMLYTNSLVGSIYLLGFISSLTGIPSTLCALVVYRIFQRRKRPLMVVLSISAAFLALSALDKVIITHIEDLVLTTCANFALVFVTVGICMIYVYVPELYPSSIRTGAFGVVFGLARFGSMLCPYVNDLERYATHGTPLLVYAGALAVAVVIITFLPDTDGLNLADFLTVPPEVTVHH
ncbi:transporter, major facilitator family protein, partial [Opisthorchis viverrini]